MRLQTSPLSAGGDQFLEAFCFATDAVGDFVYISGDQVGSTYQVEKLDPTNLNKMPFAGVLIEKSGPSDCIIQVAGVVRDLYSGMTPGKMQLAGLTARPVETLARPTTGLRVRQVAGLALSSTDMLIQTMQPVILKAV
jgi:hypothetical protein